MLITVPVRNIIRNTIFVIIYSKKAKVEHVFTINQPTCLKVRIIVVDLINAHFEKKLNFFVSNGSFLFLSLNFLLPIGPGWLSDC